MVSPAILASCGLFYSMIVVDATQPNDIRDAARNRTDIVVNLAFEQNSTDEVERALRKLVILLKENPDKLQDFADGIADSCDSITKP